MQNMGKNLSMVCIMMLILAAIVIVGEAKSEVVCSVLCRPHCKPFSSAGECSECHQKCSMSPPASRTRILRNQNNNKNIGST